MTDVVEMARKFRCFDGDCTCPGLIHEMADRIEKLEAELKSRDALEKQAHNMTSALRLVQTELNIALSSFVGIKRAADVALGDKKEGD